MRAGATFVSPSLAGEHPRPCADWEKKKKHVVSSSQRIVQEEDEDWKKRRKRPLLMEGSGK